MSLGTAEWCVGSLVLAAIVSPAHAQAPAQVPPGYESPANGSPTIHYADHSMSIRALWLSGIVLLPVSYVLTFALAAISHTPDYWPYSMIPLVGPWMMAAIAHDGSELAGAVVAGVAQAAGALLLVLGVAVRQTVRIAIYGERGSASVALMAAPLWGGAALGLELTHS